MHHRLDWQLTCLDRFVIVRAFLILCLAAAHANSCQAVEEKALDRQSAAVHAAPAASSSQENPNRPINDKWAVVIGVSKHTDSSLDLKYAAQDANNVYKYLTSEGNFKPDHVLLLTDGQATRSNILSALGDRWLPRLALPDDLVFLYFSGHGSPSNFDIGGVNYLIAHDTNPKNLYATGISMQSLARIIKERVHANRLMLVLDACHSGSARPGGKGIVRVANVSVADLVQGTGQLVISSSKATQRSWESKRYAGSVFTKYLLDGFRLEGRDTTLGSAFDFMKEKVQEEVLRDRATMQTPVMKSKWSGLELRVAARPIKPRAGMVFKAPEAVNQTASSRPTSDAKTWQKIPFKVTLNTNKRWLAGTDARVHIMLFGASGNSRQIWLPSKKHQLESGRKDTFDIKATDIGDLKKIKIGHDNSGFAPGWFLDSVQIVNQESGRSWNIPCHRWLSKVDDDGKIERELYVE